MNSKTNNFIKKNVKILEQMIETNASYDEIVKQSQKLDKYIIIEMKHINKIRVR